MMERKYQSYWSKNRGTVMLAELKKTGPCKRIDR